MKTLAKILCLIWICRALSAESTLINEVNERVAALPFIEISDEDEARLSNPDNLAFSHHIPIVLKEKGSLKSKMTDVRDQGPRGSCSTFAAIGLIEFYEGGNLSEQCLSYFSDSQDDGIARQRVEWAVENGLYREADCRYDSNEDGRENIPNLANAERITISNGYRYYPQHRYDALDFIRDQIKFEDPVIIAVYTAGRAWDETGIIDMPTPDEISAACIVDAMSSKKKCKSHAVVITGYDDDAEYLFFKNSWGNTWPIRGPLKHEGYGKMSYAYFKKMKVQMSEMVTK